MTTTVASQTDSEPIDSWQAIVAEACAWARQGNVRLADAVVLVPFAHHLPLARRAWALQGGWMPRIETSQTLARSVPPAAAQLPVAGQLRFDVALDGLHAAQMLRRQSWAAAWARDDPQGLALAAALVVATAHALARAAACVPPALRDAHWEHARDVLPLPSAGAAGARERLLCRVALEWAAAAAAPATDALFDLHPSAWIVVQAGGPDVLIRRLLDHDSGTPSLWTDTDAALIDGPVLNGRIQVGVCADFETEAHRSAAAVLAHLNAGVRPVALIAQDRALVRRVRALLARQQVPLRDETGWTLSTTRAAASVHSLLNCARGDASSDEWLDWLKACCGNAASGGEPAALDTLEALERAWRRAGVRSASKGDIERLVPAAAALLQASRQTAKRLATPAQRRLIAWLQALSAALHDCGLWARLEADNAGQQVLKALHLDASTLLRADAADVGYLSLAAFVDWVDASLEAASFLPTSDGQPQVVITPLAQAMLRPFAAVVFPGADDKHLGGVVASPGLLSDSEAQALGVPDRAARRLSQALAFAQILRVPTLTFLRRLDDNGDLLSVSPLLAQLALAQGGSNGPGLPPAADARVAHVRAAAPVARPLPRAPELLPQRLSASSCEALRACPFRFFALRMLRLQSIDELDIGVQKRDYGNWLHKVLHRFHRERSQPLPAADEAARLHAAAVEEINAAGLDAAEFLPYSASFGRFVPRYVAWLHARDEDGAQWLDGERELTSRPPEWAGTQMHGVLDRVDSVPGVNGPLIQLIDYKTGPATALRSIVKQGEDTQLAFYAALMGAQGEAPGDIAASYVFLDEGEKVVELPLPDVLAQAELLVGGIGVDLSRIRQGAAMPALGEGRSCDFCDARGLCRKDDWSGEALSDVQDVS